MIKVGVTGGIGSGKSTVCRLFGVFGVPVYDSDSRAKVLMNSNEQLCAQIKNLLGDAAYGADGQLDRVYIGSKVFAEEKLLERLNAIVHPAVGSDFERWAAEQDAPYVVLESAILIESGFDRYVDSVITVSVPQHERLHRTMLRDGADQQKIVDRMSCQMSDSEREARSNYVIRNDEHIMIYDQVWTLHELFIQKSEAF